MTRARDLAAFVSNADGDIKFDTDTLFIDSSANRVGIGTTTPDRSLHIAGNPAQIIIEDTGGGTNDKRSALFTDSGVFEIASKNDDDSTRVNDIFCADLGTGNIGIGTNTPERALHIKSADNIIGLIESTDADAWLAFQDDTSASNNAVRVGATGDVLRFYAGSAERMRIESGGNVGIATTSVSSIGGNHKTVQINGANANGTGALRLQSTDGSLDSGFWQTTNGVFFGAISDHPIIFRTNNTERMRLLSGGGLTFNGDTATANALDDYEEGTWTPTVSSGGSTLGNISGSSVYTKIGNFVHVQFYINSLASTTSSSFRVDGLPFANIANGQTVGSVMHQNVDIPGTRTTLVAYAPSNGTIVRFYGVGDSTTWQELTGTNVGTSFNLIVNIQYRTS